MKRILAVAALLFAVAAHAQVTITNVYVSASTSTTATINWTTSGPASSQVFYGYDASLPWSNNVSGAMVTNHQMTLTVLVASQLYYFAVKSVDGGGHVTQSATKNFALCGGPGIAPVSGTINNYYQYGSYTLTWNPPSGSAATPMICGVPVTQTVTGYLSGGASFSNQVADSYMVVPGPGSWTVAVTDAGNLSPISINYPITSTSNDVSGPLQTAAASAGLTAVIANTVNQTVYPAWVGGTGSVNPGTAGQIAWYAANGKILSGSNVVPSAVLEATLSASPYLLTDALCSANGSGIIGSTSTSGLIACNPLWVTTPVTGGSSLEGWNGYGQNPADIQVDNNGVKVMLDDESGGGGQVYLYAYGGQDFVSVTNGNYISILDGTQGVIVNDNSGDVERIDPATGRMTWENDGTGSLMTVDGLNGIIKYEPDHVNSPNVYAFYLSPGGLNMESHKITGLTNGSASSDAAAFGQIPTIVQINSTNCTLGGSYNCSIALQECNGVGCQNHNQYNAPFTTTASLYPTTTVHSGDASFSVTSSGDLAGYPSTAQGGGCLGFVGGEFACYTTISGATISGISWALNGTTPATHNTNEPIVGIVNSLASCSTCVISQTLTNTGQFAVGMPNAGLNPTFWVDGSIGGSVFNGDVFVYGAITSFASITGGRQGYATSTHNYGSFPLATQGNYWNGTTSQDDSWQWATVMGTGTNPATTYLLTHAGTPGGANVEIPYATRLTPRTYSSLNGSTPCGSAYAGSMASITDASTQTWGATVSGGGTPGTDTLVYCDGTNWTVAGK